MTLAITRLRSVGVAALSALAVVAGARRALGAPPPAPQESPSVSGARSDEPGPAYIFAEGFGRRADSIVTFENLLGYDKQKEKYDAVTAGESDAFASARYGLFPSRTVRFGAHYVVDSLLTVGTGVGFWVLSSASSAEKDSTISQFELRPRIGLALPVSRLFGFWPRVGASLLYRSAHDYSAWMLSPSLDLLAVCTPVDHFGVLGGLTLDLAAAGKAGPKNETQDARYESLGLTVGLMADF